MKIPPYHLFLAACAASLACAALHSPAARATLGETIASVELDRRALSAVARSAAEVNERFAVQEIASGPNLVREYIAPSGKVFAVAWNGVSRPDLSQLLGAYSAEYRDAAMRGGKIPGQRHSVVKTDRVVVETWGNIRSLHGRAYDPSLVPAGVDANEIR